MGELGVPLKPVGRQDIHRLETALMIATLLREDVLDKIRESSERLTWIDSLAVAAGALARQKAGMSISEIAEDLGRTEATIRRHLQGKSEAGRLVLETYERFVKEGVKIEVPRILLGSKTAVSVEALKRELEEEKKKRRELEEKLEKIRESLKRILDEI